MEIILLPWTIDNTNFYYQYNSKKSCELNLTIQLHKFSYGI